MQGFFNVKTIRADFMGRPIVVDCALEIEPQNLDAKISEILGALLGAEKACKIEGCIVELVYVQ